MRTHLLFIAALVTGLIVSLPRVPKCGMGRPLSPCPQEAYSGQPQDRRLWHRRCQRWSSIYSDMAREPNHDLKCILIVRDDHLVSEHYFNGDRRHFSSWHPLRHKERHIVTDGHCNSEGTAAQPRRFNLALPTRFGDNASHLPLDQFARANLFDPLAIQKYSWRQVPIDRTHQQQRIPLSPRPPTGDFFIHNFRRSSLCLSVAILSATAYQKTRTLQLFHSS
jgi:hypothetical protein